MSVRQWKRVVEVTISGKAGTLTVRDLTITFSVSKSIGSKQNTATISIMNLTKSHRRQIGEEFDKIELKAGYEGGPLSTIFKGDIEDVEHTKDTADVKSEMTCGDGNEGVQKGAVSKTFPAGTKPKAIIEYLQSEMPGTTKGEMKGIDDLPAYKRPVSLYGWAAREMDKLGREHGFYWSIQNGEVEAVKNDQVLSRTTVVSKETGMIGIPTVTDKGVRIKALLNSEIAPGRTIDVRSDFLDEASGKDKRKSDDGGGLFRVSEVTFSGTNRGEEFYVEAEGNRIEGSKVVK
jgi:ethanolamine utilization microcompartment shell protein EutS